MRRNPARRVIAAVLSLLLVAAQPAWTVCPHAADASRDAPAAHDHDAGSKPAPETDAPDCPLGAPSAGCGVALSAPVTSRLRLAPSDDAHEPDWLVAARTDLTHASAIFHPPIG